MPNLRSMRLARARRVPRPLAPSAVQLAYFAELRAILEVARELVKERLGERLPDLVASQRTDAAERADAGNPTRRVNRIMDRVSDAFYRRFPHERLARLAERMADRASTHQRGQLQRQVKAAVGVDLALADRGVRPHVQQFVAENVALIKSVPQMYFDDVEKRVLMGMREGLRHTEIAAQLEERFGVAESRAKLIARDQVNKFTGALNKVRQEQLGIGAYIWRTMNDNRVRSEHEDREGRHFTWDAPPEDGHPGEPINCRCYAEPDFAGIVEGE